MTETLENLMRLADEYAYKLHPIDMREARAALQSALSEVLAEVERLNLIAEQHRLAGDAARADVERLTIEKKAAAMNYEAVIEGLKAQEPVAWLSTDSIGERYLSFDKPLDDYPKQPLFLASGAAPHWEDGTEPLVAGGLVRAGKVDMVIRASGAAPKTLSDFVHSSDSEREKIGNVVAAKADEAMDKLVKLSEELGLYDGAAQKENT